MKSTVLRWTVGIALASGTAVSMVWAEEASKPLPTLLIKGEVVSLDTNDPTANLLKVKDRYGFETPIFLTPETKITKGEAPVQAANLAAGTGVEVEYNFDINTAKRHAVSVKVASATPAMGKTVASTTATSVPVAATATAAAPIMPPASNAAAMTQTTTSPAAAGQETEPAAETTP